ncbi:TniB family NTP-binding protein [Azospirillum isscasi]|uniref:TniB family NTP-binding protein n=1 Tax=Azospirillum isscasi TaxID=3053926 RepID=A0ABU0WFG6_9PROT|nr:TniB family NTP-binding protein [Azospirillum isscasi]MDQ2102881.1 TniB family NTP-binding protein [Azospirillum isscasi]
MNRNDRVRRLFKLKNVFADTERTREATERIQCLHENHGTGLEARCLLLTGLQGAGKSTVLKRYALRHPDTAEELRDRRPILQLDVPAEATLRSLASTMLATLGDLVPSRGNQVEMTVRVQGLLRKLGVELVILDEIHHLIHSSTHKIAYDAAEWIKGMLNANICPFVLAGQPYADRIVASNPQLRRRCEGEVYLPSYDWEDERQRTEFRVVLNALEHALELPGASRPGSYDTALRRELPCLSHELLAEATDWLRVREDRRLVNPFRVPSIRPVRPAERNEALVPRLRDEVARRSRKPRGGDDAA